MPSKRPKRPPPKKARKSGEAIPWPDIEQEYVEGGDEVTHRFLARKWVLKPMQVGHYASANHWTVKRLAYRSRLREAVSRRVFEEKVAIGVDVKLRGIANRQKHMAILEGALDVCRGSKLMKLRSQDVEDVYEIEHEWTSADHVNYRKAYDEAEAGVFKALGLPEGFLVQSGGAIAVYIPDHGGALPDDGDDDGEA